MIWLNERLSGPMHRSVHLAVVIWEQIAVATPAEVKKPGGNTQST
jgi:hypothetical protein